MALQFAERLPGTWDTVLLTTEHLPAILGPVLRAAEHQPGVSGVPRRVWVTEWPSRTVRHVTESLSCLRPVTFGAVSRS
jgi:hypothetical protein